MLRLYRCLLYAYPPGLRRAHGREMTAAFGDAWTAARAKGTAAQARLLVTLLLDFFRCWPAAWRSHTPLRKASPMRTPILMHVKFGLRLLIRHPASAIATVLTLALAIGLNTAVFSVVHAVLLQPLPYPEADGLVRVWEHNFPRNKDRNSVSAANFLEWRDRAKSFSGMATFGERRATLTGDGAPEEVPAIGSTWNLFDVLKVPPAHGRAFASSDAEAGAPPVAIMSWSLWQRRYGGDPHLVGRKLSINGRSTEIIGILPERFTFFGDMPEIYAPLIIPASARIPVGRSLRVVARLGPGVSVDEANAEMATISAALREQWKDFNAGWGSRVVGVLDDMVGPTRPVLYLLLAAVGLVLLVGCANTANLLLARASERRRELAVRAAVGASTRDLFRQLLVEGTLLAGLGAVTGIGLAVIALRLSATRIAELLHVPRLGDASLHPIVLLFTLGLMVLCALVFSVLPALHLDSAASSGVVREARSATGTRRDQRVRQTLVVVQLALAVVLVIAGGLVARSLAKLTSVDTGFDARGVLTFSVSLPAATYPTAETVRFFDTLAGKLEALPGVSRAGGIAWLPFTGLGGATSYTVVGEPRPPAADLPIADVRPVTDGYFDSMRLAIRKGRGFTPLETRESHPVIVVNETLARMLRDGQAVGRRLVVEWAEKPVEDEIIGVVADSRLETLTAPMRPTIYYPLAASPVRSMAIVVRTDGAPLSLARAVEDTVHNLDANLPVTRLRTMEQVMGLAVATPAVTSWLVMSFAGLALILALIGIAGLQAATVAARIPEFGVRLALGATPAGLRWFVLSRGAILIAIGLGAGAILASFIARVATRQLYDVTATDPLVFLSAIVGVAALSLLASDIPARRATRVNPASVLRN
jgi:putative ABC transport system permease protein